MSLAGGLSSKIAKATLRGDAMVGVVFLILALLVGAGVFTVAHRFLKRLGGPPESDTGQWVEPPGASGDEDV